MAGAGVELLFGPFLIGVIMLQYYQAYKRWSSHLRSTYVFYQGFSLVSIFLIPGDVISIHLFAGHGINASSGVLTYFLMTHKTGFTAVNASCARILDFKSEEAKRIYVSSVEHPLDNIHCRVAIVVGAEGLQTFDLLAAFSESRREGAEGDTYTGQSVQLE
ncbi:hypothetical protein B0H13DRAFT_1874197 [Mycena leptocephala]|nr:hypothetical protein B0H13DRAFT_1874197 [Mycena leptocephala]